MKKIIAFAAAAFAALSFAQAQSESLPSFEFGARAAFSLGVGTSASDEFFTASPAKNASFDVESDIGNCLGFNFSAFADIHLLEVGPGLLGVQPELGFTHSSVGSKVSITGGGKSVGDVTLKASYNTLDIPILLSYKIPVNDKVFVTPLLGPRFSILVGQSHIETDGISNALSGSGKQSQMYGDFSGDFDIDTSVLASLTIGAKAGFAVGPGSILADLRYNIGFNALKVSGVEIGTPRALLIGLGYQMKL